MRQLRVTQVEIFNSFARIFRKIIKELFLLTFLKLREQKFCFKGLAMNFRLKVNVYNKIESFGKRFGIQKFGFFEN